MPSPALRYLPVIMAVSAISLTSCEKEEAVFPEAATAVQRQQAVSATIPGRYLVAFRQGQANVRAAFQQLAKEQPHIGQRAQLVEGKVFAGFYAQLNPAELAQLRQNKSIAFVEPDQRFSVKFENDAEAAQNRLSYGTDYTPFTPPQPDPVFTITPDSTQTISWGATRVGVGRGIIAGRKAWVVDSGIQLNHPDLDVDIALSHSFLSTSTDPGDEFGHGTQVAGILGARDNGYGVVGVAAGARLVSLRVMNASGNGTVSSVISALNYIAEHGTPGDVVCLSLGANPSLALDNAVVALANLGIFITVAAGNSNADAANLSPARVNHANVFTVSGLRPDGTYMGISNWGSPVDYCAPGTALQTTKINSGYGSAGGTSMATPHVAGILLVRGNIATDGFVANDPDGNPDPIPHM